MSNNWLAQSLRAQCSPIKCRPYLAGIVGRGSQLKFLLPLGRLESRKRGGVLRHVQRVVARKRMPRTLCSRVVGQCAACGAGSHVLACTQLDSITSGAFGQLMFDDPLDTVLLGLLGDNYWGDN
jgi:hypothetical protein